jgi:hypothetical protein
MGFLFRPLGQGYANRKWLFFQILWLINSEAHAEKTGCPTRSRQRASKLADRPCTPDLPDGKPGLRKLQADT